MISVIIPVLNEADCLEKTLKSLLALPCQSGLEIIVSDGGSTDHTIGVAQRYATVVSAPRGKAWQLNAGAAAAGGDVLFFAHADMQFPQDTLLAIHRQIYQEGMDGGGFANVFDEYNQRIKRLGRILNFRFRNREQSDRNIFYGDNGIFVRREAFDALEGFKEISIMEDYDFSIRLRESYQVQLIREPRLIVSARRHIKAGFFKTRMQWILIKKLYLLGVSPERLARWYADVR